MPVAEVMSVNTAVPIGTAGATGHVRGVRLVELGSLEMKSTATCPTGSPVDGTAGQLVSGCPATGMWPNFVTS